MKSRTIGDRTIYRLRLTRTGAGSTITIPRDVIRTLGWRYGHTLAMAMIEQGSGSGSGSDQGSRRDGDYSHRMRVGIADPIDSVQRFVGIVITRDDNVPALPGTSANDSPPYTPRRYQRIQRCRLRTNRTTSTFAVTIPRQFIHELRWRESDSMFDERGDTIPIMLAMVVMSDGVVVSRIDA